MKIITHQDDLPNNLKFNKSIAIDTETMGLRTKRDRLCLVQISQGDSTTHLIKINNLKKNTPHNLKKLLLDKKIEKIFHFARFDIATLSFYVGKIDGPIWCTKIASKLCRTYTDRHGLSDLCKELLSVDLSKQQQSSNWGSSKLTKEQKKYASNDVIYLHLLKDKLIRLLEQEGRLKLAEEIFMFLKTRVKLDLEGFNDLDIFSH